MNSLVVRPEAESDILEALSWYTKHSRALSDQFLTALDDTFGATSENPLRFPIVHESSNLSVRRALVRRFPYAVYFVWNESARSVDVLACLHARQAPRRWLRRLR